VPIRATGRVTDIRFTVLAGGTGDVLWLSPATGCGAGSGAEILLTPGNGEYQFPAGLAVHASSGLSFHVVNVSGTEDNVTIYADGYTVPATALP